jgi:hypothetical protein
MFDVLSYLPARRKQTASGWISFNAVCCSHNGQNVDKRSRGGLKQSDQGWSYHCFNCGYTASFIIGRNVSLKARRLLAWLNVPQEEIERINLESLRHRSVEGLINDRQRVYGQLADIKFDETDLPTHTEFLDDPNCEEYQYLVRRCAPMDYPYMIIWNGDSNKQHHTRSGIVIPFTYNDVVVGYTIRFLDDRMPKYINNMQPGYVFGTDLQKDSWQCVVVCEGIFDALSISGLAVMHNDINDAQARLIRSLGKEIIVVPDQDTAGIALIDRATELGWSVSIPEWPEDVKDINDAVKKFGRIGTLLTIMQSRETSRIKIEIRKKQLVKRLQR